MRLICRESRVSARHEHPFRVIATRPEAKVAAWIERQLNDTLFVSVVTLGELRRGTTLLTEVSMRKRELEKLIEERVPAWFENRILPVTRTIAERWGVLDGERQIAGRPLNIADGLIAATAMEHDLILVTRNIRDFMRLNVETLNPWHSN